MRCYKRSLGVVLAVFFLALLYLGLMACAAQGETGFEDSNEKQYIAGMKSNELQGQLEEIDRDIADTRVQRDYLKNEPPDVSDDSVEIERTGFGSAGEIKSNLLNPRAEYETEKKLRELYETKEMIERELDRRHDYHE